MGVRLGNQQIECPSQILIYNRCNKAVYAISTIRMTLATRRVLANARYVSLLLLAGQLPKDKYIFTHSAVLLTGNGASVFVS